MEIINELLKRGYKKGQLIDYSEFLQMYEPYKEILTDTKFAREIGFTKTNYQRFKHTEGARTRIMRNAPEISEERRKQIKNEIMAKGYKPEQSINYQEFLRLYRPYEKEMNELDFAKILDLSNNRYTAIKKDKDLTTRILRGEKMQLSQSDSGRVEQIRKEIFAKGYFTGQLINYAEFLELYRPYEKELSIDDFLEILRISRPKYREIKNKGKRTKLLKSNEMLSAKREKEILSQISKMGYTYGKRISYRDFLKIYSYYKQELTEIDFARVLGISHTNYKRMKNSEIFPRIAKSEDVLLNQETRNEIVQNVLARGCHLGQLISYSQFLELYEPYKDSVLERQFAEALGISEVNYLSIRSRRERRTKILVNYERVNEAKREQIIDKAMQSGYNVGQLINYSQFLELYSSFKGEITEQRFSEILGISQDSYGRLVSNPKKKVIIFSTLKRDVSKTKNELIETLLSQGYKKGQTVSYEEFLQMYQKYGHFLTQIEFAEALGIEYGNYENIKYRGTRARILKNVSPKPQSGNIVKEEQASGEILLNGVNIIDDIKTCIEHGVDKDQVLKLLMGKYKMTMQDVVAKVEAEYGKTSKADSVLPDEKEYLGEEL